MKNMECYICKNKSLTKILDLGKHPVSDGFVRPKDLEKDEEVFPLVLCFCDNCKLMQLNYAVSPEKLFKDYVYNTASNNSLKANFSALAMNLIAGYKLGPKDLVIDIGSNDGTLLENFLDNKIKILGVDPSSVAKLALEKGVPTLVEFFSHRLAKNIKKEHGQAKIITATNVFAHVKDLDDFMAGVKELLKPDGIFVSESGYLMDMVEKLQYDSIYHEHLRYYSLKPLIILFENFGMEIFNVERIASHGGSIRVYAGHKEYYPVSREVRRLLSEEKEKGLYDRQVLLKFSERVEESKEELRRLILGIKEKGQRIVGIGAPAKGNTLLNYCGLNRNIIDYLAEKSSLKIGTFAPGTHIPVINEAKLFSDQPEYALLLSWNLAEELVAKLRQLGYKGKFILPTPKPKIL